MLQNTLDERTMQIKDDIAYILDNDYDAKYMIQEVYVRAVYDKILSFIAEQSETIYKPMLEDGVQPSDSQLGYLRGMITVRDHILQLKSEDLQ